MHDTTSLLPALEAALEARRALITRLAAEQTEARVDIAGEGLQKAVDDACVHGRGRSPLPSRK